MSKEIPTEVQEQINAAVDALKEYDKNALIQLASEHGAEFKPDDVNEGWLRRKVGRLVKEKIMKDAGVEPATVSQPVEAVAGTGNGEKPAKKAGRKRMDTSGVYKIVLAEGQSAGREGSTKFKIVSALKDKESFTHDEFKAAVKDAMGWTPGEKGDEDGSFGISTKFPSIGAATAAWFSELKNKQEIVRPVESQSAPPATATAN